MHTDPGRTYDDLLAEVDESLPQTFTDDVATPFDTTVIGVSAESPGSTSTVTSDAASSL